MPARVLVVEDDQSISFVLAELLLDEGYEVRAALGGREALQLLGEWRPDLILLDLMMPGMSGVDFHEARQQAGFGSVPVVVVSAARDAEVQAKAIGAVGRLPKPFEIDGVIEVVASAIAGSR